MGNYGTFINSNELITTERQIGTNRYCKHFSTSGVLTVGAWTAFADLSAYSNVVVDFGKSIVYAENTMTYPVDYAITTVTFRYNRSNSKLEYYAQETGKSSAICAYVEYSK